MLDKFGWVMVVYMNSLFFGGMIGLVLMGLIVIVVDYCMVFYVVFVVLFFGLVILMVIVRVCL